MLLQIGTYMFLPYRKSASHLFDLSLNCFTSIFYAKYTELIPSSLPSNKKLLRPTLSQALQGAGV